MTGHIPETFIDELLDRVDIVQLIHTRVTGLKRQGANYVACCPFHKEKTASFNVSQSKKCYHCFGCGAHGDAIRFLTEYEGLHFVEAVETLANSIGLTIPRDSKESLQKSKLYSEIYVTLEAANIFFQEQLIKAPTKDKAIQYLKQRGLSKQSIIDFNIGYAPPGWDTLFKALGKDQNHIQNLLSAGLIIAKENKPYFDRFRDRIMFPIRNRKGQVVGFGGRTLTDQMPKYLNSPETPVFNKSSELFGLFEARAKNRSLSPLIVVEGYLDVISLVQFGIKNVVATQGTSLTEKHLDILFRESQELIFCFDGDTAGRNAARRVLMLCLPHIKEGRRIRFMLLPEKEDPDSFIRKQGALVFEQQLEKSKNFSDFLFESFLGNLDMHQVEGRAEAVRIFRPMISKMPPGIVQEMMFARLAEITNIPLEHIHQQKGVGPRKTTQDNLRPGSKPGQRGQKPPPDPAYRAAALLLANSSLLRYIKTPSDFLSEGPGVSLLCGIIEALRMEPHLNPKGILEKLEQKEGLKKELSYLNNFSAVAHSLPEQGIEAEFLGALSRLKESALETELETLLRKAKNNPLSTPEKDKLKELLNQKEKRRAELNENE